MVLLRRLRRPRPLQCRFLSTTRTLRNAEEPPKPDTKPKPFYITTPIFYPNAAPHIGHLYSLVTADVFARFQRLKGQKDLRFLTGTDEHGMKIQKAAKVYYDGQSGRELDFVNNLSKRFRDLSDKASISSTVFVRTSKIAHWQTVQHVWRNLYEKGYIYKSRYEGWYSVTDESFYTDSQVKDGVSLETGAAVEWTSEENYMFRLSAFQEPLLQHYLSHPRSVYPPQYHDNVVAMLGGAPLHRPTLEENDDVEKVPDSPVENVATIEDVVLSDISISRPSSRLEWGVEVPGDPQQTVYVWFDALLVYLTGAGYPWTDPPSTLQAVTYRKGGWPADIQVIGKDILRFHAIYFPAILLALSGGPYNPSPSAAAPPRLPVTKPKFDAETVPVELPGTLLTHAHWTSGKKKMSKSLGNVANPLKAMEKYGVDAVRFYLMRVGGRWRDDVDWSGEQLHKHHKEIQTQLGNYAMRASSAKIFELAGTIAEEDASSGLPPSIKRLYDDNETVPEGHLADADSDVDPNAELLRAVMQLSAKVESHLDTFEAGNALAEIMDVLKLANKTFTDVAPWDPRTPSQTVNTTRIVALETLRIVGLCLTPFMPNACQSLLESLGQTKDTYRTGFSIPTKQGKVEMEALWARWTGKKVEPTKMF